MDKNGNRITVETVINAHVEKVWQVWTTPEHIMNWNYASHDWHTPYATNDLRNGGTFNYRMEAKDGSFGFDFGGTYDKVVKNQFISYTIGDGRKVEITFSEDGISTRIVECFEPEQANPIEMQKEGWQAILHNFKMYVENLRKEEDLQSISQL